MKKNMGVAGKALRILSAVVIGILYYVGVISGMVAITLGVLAIVFIITSFMSFCPFYLPFGLSTRGKG